MAVAPACTAAQLAIEPSVSLVIGVLSFNLTGRATRRSYIRRAAARSSTAALRFAMPSDEADADRSPDVLRCPVPLQGRSVSGKFFLQNAFLRYGAELPAHVKFVARADDDTLFYPPTIAHALTISARSSTSEHLVYGSHKNWYMWLVESMQAARCLRLTVPSQRLLHGFLRRSLHVPHSCVCRLRAGHIPRSDGGRPGLSG